MKTHESQIFTLDLTKNKLYQKRLARANRLAKINILIKVGLTLIPLLIGFLIGFFWL